MKGLQYELFVAVVLILLIILLVLLYIMPIFGLSFKELV